MLKCYKLLHLHAVIQELCFIIKIIAIDKRVLLTTRSTFVCQAGRTSYITRKMKAYSLDYREKTIDTLIIIDGLTGIGKTTLQKKTGR